MLKAIEKTIARELNRYPYVKQIVKRAYTLPFMAMGRFMMRPESVAARVEIGESDTESFFGYYDLWPENGDGLVLCHQSRHPTKLVPNAAKAIEVCLFAADAPASPLIKTQTHAYNWQQGARLQWLSKKEFIFNDFDPEKNQYHARIFDAEKGVELAQAPMPIQTRIDDTSFLSLNYQRLARLRPDYGYFNLPPEACDVTDLRNDGIWWVNVKDGSHDLLYSMADIIEAGHLSSAEKLSHKVNHLMLSPDGQAFVMLHRMFKGGQRSGRLLVGDIAGSPLQILPGDTMISHYCWVGDKTLLCFMRTDECGDGYYLVHIDSQKAELLPGLTALTPGDGHPSSLGNGRFITDSYPDRYGYQKLMLGDYRKQTISELASLYHARDYRGVTRCDLHPRGNVAHDYCYFDTVTSGRRRLTRMRIAT
jgi:hypothetical protein